MGSAVIIERPSEVHLPPAFPTAPEWAAMQRRTDVLMALRFDPSDLMYGAVRGSVSAAQRAVNRQAIQLAADDAAIAGGTLVIKGEYEVDGQIIMRGHIDGADGTLKVYNASVSGAILYGSLTSPFVAYGRRVHLPAIWQMNKPATGWNANDIGLIASNVHTCEITIPHIRGFSRGVLFTAKSGGNAYHNVYLGLLENNKIGLDIAAEDVTGWTNEIVWFGGRFQMNTNEGTNISGARHILVRGTPYVSNNHLFVKPSVEGNGPEFHVESGGAHITIEQGRWEAAPPKIRLAATSNGFYVNGGYGAEGIVLSLASGAVGSNTRILHRQGGRGYFGGGIGGAVVLTNHSSSTWPAITVMNAGSGLLGDPETAYSVQIGPISTRFKRAADTHDRLIIDANWGRISFGDGASAPDTNLEVYGTAGVRTNKKLLAVEGLGTGGYTAGTPGTTFKGSVPIYDQNGNLLGRVPVV